ncbi:MAG TPA: pantoate--beta-alanine ligase [Ferruginibacter sp.]|nr:pantoate--beta-alanine ligase [Ferruginibacter sp.]HQR01195.1 pantoate--beta-alanine ligase [Ferruginibacter sp.]
MIIFKKAADIGIFLQQKRQNNPKTGFVPTMGALHQGHISLIESARSENDVVVCSIFVNPTQFNDPKDFQNYPITIENDIDLLEKAGCDALFLPAVEEMYPAGLENKKTYALGYLETVLEGRYRPGHFQGVCQVVHRLLTIVPADRLYLGQKDFQQCMVIRKMIELENLPIETVICPTLRETDGLAMSSRNMRLDKEAREKAVEISRTLLHIKSSLKTGDLSELKTAAVEQLNRTGFKTDYVEIADADTLELIGRWDGKRKLVALCAAFLGEVRLIDNMLLQA